jgi:hypothetical protein
VTRGSRKAPAPSRPRVLFAPDRFSSITITMAGRELMLQSNEWIGMQIICLPSCNVDPRSFHDLGEP